MNDDMDPDLSKPVGYLPFEKASSTRWLVRGKVLFNILTNWEELKAYFTCCEQAQCRPDARYKARMIKEMLCDNKNYPYFVFSTPIVQEFEKQNSLFQKTKEDPHCLIKELLLQYKSLESRLYSPSGEMKALDAIDFGSKFVTEVNSKLLQEEDRVDIKKRCKAMLEEAFEQMGKRMPPVQDISLGSVF